MKATKKQAGKRSGRGVPGGKRTASARSARIAPLLTAMVSEFARDADRDMASETWALAYRELRALLAVARAASTLVGQWRATGIGNGNACDALDAAVARLSRAGGEAR